MMHLGTNRSLSPVESASFFIGIIPERVEWNDPVRFALLAVVRTLSFTQVPGVSTVTSSHKSHPCGTVMIDSTRIREGVPVHITAKVVADMDVERT